MDFGGDYFLWKIDQTLFLLNGENNKKISKKFVCQNTSGETLTWWEIILKIQEIDGLKYVSLFLITNIYYENYHMCIQRCLPRYQCYMVNSNDIEVSSLSDVWLPSLKQNECRGSDVFLLYDVLLEQLQNLTQKYIVVKLQLQYRSSLGKYYGLDLGLFGCDQIVSYSILGKTFQASSNYFARSNLITKSTYNEFHKSHFSFDECVSDQTRFLLRNRFNSEFTIEKFNSYLLAFLISPCESRLFLLPTSGLLYILELFDYHHMNIYTDIVASAIKNRVPRLKDLIKIKMIVRPSIVLFNLMFWSVVLVAFRKRQVEPREYILLQEFFVEEQFGPTVSQKSEKIILSFFNRSIKNKLAINLNHHETPGSVLEQHVSYESFNATAA